MTTDLNVLVTLLEQEAVSWDLQICPNARHPDAINRNAHAERRADLLRQAAAAILALNTRAASGDLNEPFGNPEQLPSLEQGARELPPIVREVLEWYASDPSIWVGWTQEDWAEEERAKASGHYTFIGEDKRGHNEYVPNHVRAEEALAALDEWLEQTAALTNQQGVGGAKDTERLDWLDAQNLQQRMGWKVSQAPAGNVSVQHVVFLGSEPVPIRAAIDAAMSTQPAGGVDNG